MVHIPLMTNQPSKRENDEVDEDCESLNSYISRKLSNHEDSGAGSYVADHALRSNTSLNTEELEIMLNEVPKIPKVKQIRHEVYQTLSNPSHSKWAFAWTLVVNLLIITSVIIFCIETVPSISKLPAWAYIEYAIIAIFTMELIMRIVTCPRLIDFLKSWLNWVDFVAIAPFFAELIIEKLRGGGRFGALGVVKAIRLMRCLRLLKLGKNSEKFTLIIKALKISGDGVALLFMILFFFNIVFSSLIYYVETAYCRLGDDNVWRYSDGAETKFQSILASMWWTMLTITTVGYGDIVPKSEPGKIIATCCMIAGIMLLSFPITILGHSFAEVYRKNKAEKLREARQGRLVRLMEKTGNEGASGEAPFADMAEFEQRLGVVLLENHNTIEKLQTSLKQANEELDRLRGSEVLILQMTRRLVRDHETQRAEIARQISTRRYKRATAGRGPHIAAATTTQMVDTWQSKSGGTPTKGMTSAHSDHVATKTPTGPRRTAKISPEGMATSDSEDA